MISEKYNITGETPILPRRNYVEVITRKAKQGKDARPEQRVCNHLTPAIYADGIGQRPTREGMRRPNVQSSFPRATDRRKNSGCNGKRKRQPQTGRSSRRFPSGTGLWPMFSNV